MSFWEQAGAILLKQRAAAMQAKDDMQRLIVHDIAKGQEMHRMHIAQGLGLAKDYNPMSISNAPSPEAFRAPYGETTNVMVNNITEPALPALPAPPAPQQPIPAKPASSLLKTLGMTALMATGGGGLVAAGGFGAYSLLKEQLNKPVQIDPANFKARISFDPDKGIEAGPLEPAK
jgi:hypothetical protein